MSGKVRLVRISPLPPINVHDSTGTQGSFRRHSLLLFYGITYTLSNVRKVANEQPDLKPSLIALGHRSLMAKNSRKSESRRERIPIGSINHANSFPID